jgi:hypothetical protein
MADSAAQYGDYSAVPGLGVPAAARDSFWSYPAPPEDTMAYADWCRMADEDMTGRRGYDPPGECWSAPSGRRGPWDDPPMADDDAWDPGWPPMSSEDM